MRDYEPDWYLQETERIKAEMRRDEIKRDRNRTWSHPMDWVLAIAFVAVLVWLVMGCL